MRPILLPSLLLTIALASAAAAQTPPPPGAETMPETPQPQSDAQRSASIVAEPVALMIAAFDADGDARVTRAEFDAGVAHVFQPAGGSMGYLDFGDWAKRWLGDANALPSPFELDRNGDNRITREEFAIRFDLYFAHFDANKDGVLDRSELLTIRNPGFGRDDRDGRRRRR